MRKLYFIASVPKAAKTNTITGVVANGAGREATDEELSSIITLLREKGATASLLDSLRDGTYPNRTAVFDRRAAAREEVALLRSYTGSFFNWHVLEVGESIRKPVRSPLGWRITYGLGRAGRDVSSHNLHEDATVLIYMYDGADSEYNRLFPTRDAAREVFKQTGLAGWGMGYRIEPYYE